MSDTSLIDNKVIGRPCQVRADLFVVYMNISIAVKHKHIAALRKRFFR